MQSYRNKADTVCTSHRNENHNTFKAGKQTASDVQHPASAIKKASEEVDAPIKKTDKRTSDGPYENARVIPETDNISLVKNKTYQAIAFIFKY